MTCKDCIHYVACKDNKMYYNDKWWNSTTDCHRIKYDSMLDYCSHFIKRDLVIELPCKVGDTVYIVLSDINARIIECYVDEFTTVLETGKNETYAVLSGNDKQYYNMLYRFKVINISEIGKGFYLTKEEAEKALKEREKK